MKPARAPASGVSEPMDVLHAIGNTSMVRLRKVVPPERADVVVKLQLIILVKENLKL